MTTSHCILLGVPLTTKNDSGAHVIPSALGGRLKPKGILSDAANGILNEKFDMPLVKAFAPLMALLGGSRDRGENQPVQMTDEAGIKYYVVYGKPLSLAKPGFSESEGPNGEKYYQIIARSVNEARQLLGRVKKRHPSFDIESELQRRVVSESYPDGRLSMQLQIGPIVLFPASFVMGSVYAAYHQLPVHPDFTRYAKKFHLKTPELPPETFYWAPTQQWFRIDGEKISHILIIFGDTELRQSIFYAELFNLPGVAVKFPFEGEESYCHSYGLDLVSGTEITVHVDQKMLRSLEWRATHQLGDESLYKESEERLRRIMSAVVERSRKYEISRIIEEVLGPPNGRPFTKEDADALARRIAEFAVRTLLKLPRSTPP